MKHNVERKAFTQTKARSMARSGNYSGFRAIKNRLEEFGFPEARTMFANEWTKSEIDRLCLGARLRKRAPRLLLLNETVLRNGNPLGTSAPPARIDAVKY